MKQQNRRIFLDNVRICLVCMLLGLVLAACGSAEYSWAPAGGRMMSRWAKGVAEALLREGENVLAVHGQRPGRRQYIDVGLLDLKQ
ncbi:MAG: hypothetical protein ACYTFK_12645 [Planctomycetota bacterium]|jgi:hypothetical protein